MRRNDKQINGIAAVANVLGRAKVCRLGLCENDRPYVVPLCFGYEDNALYIHSAGQGKKLDIIRKNNNVCFEVDIDCRVAEAGKVCDWGMKFKSVIGFGKAVFIEGSDEKRKALNIIMAQYSEQQFQFPKNKVRATAVFKVEIESMTGKQSI